MFVTAKFRTYCHATEEEKRVRKALRFVSGVRDKDIKLTINRGYHGNEIRILEASLKKGPRLTNFLERMVEAGIFDKVAHEMDARLDDECVFYLRFKKQEAFGGELVLESGEDTIQVRAKVQAFPAKPEKAVEAIKAQVEKIGRRLARKTKKKGN
jgi:RNA binding exosome subunit